MELPTWVVQAATILGVMIALLTFAKGVLEYARQNVLRRADHFGSLRAQLKGNDIFRDITEKRGVFASKTQHVGDLVLATVFFIELNHVRLSDKHHSQLFFERGA